MKLKKEVKQLLWKVLVVISLITLIIINKNLFDNAVESCVNGGNDYNYCVEKLG